MPKAKEILRHKMARAKRKFLKSISHGTGREKPVRYCGLEACSLCQLDCAGCYMRKWPRDMGYLKLKDFKRFIRLNPRIEEIELSNDGEIFLNPDLIEIIKYAYARDIKLTAKNGVNFNTVSDDMLKTLVEYEFGAMTISIDGSSPEVYAKYRRNGNFDAVISNIKKLRVYMGGELKKDKLDLSWQYIILPSTDDEKEIKRAKKMAGEFGMRIFFKRDDNGYYPRNPAMIESECGLSYDKDSCFQSNIKRRYFPCWELFNSPRIGYDGAFLGCCCHPWKKLPVPNCFESKLDGYLSSSIVKDIRAMIQGGAIPRGVSCVNCRFFKEMAKSGKYVRDEELMPDYKFWL